MITFIGLEWLATPSACPGRRPLANRPRRDHAINSSLLHRLGPELASSRRVFIKGTSKVAQGFIQALFQLPEDTRSFVCGPPRRSRIYASAGVQLSAEWPESLNGGVVHSLFRPRCYRTCERVSKGVRLVSCGFPDVP